MNSNRVREYKERISELSRNQISKGRNGATMHIAIKIRRKKI